MSRNPKKRKICHIPPSKVFTPEHPSTNKVIITLDELEALRLSDVEQMDQDRAAELMEISRTTFQRVLHSAHKQIAHALVDGSIIEIDGGKYAISDNHCGQDQTCVNCRFDADVSSPTLTDSPPSRK